MWLVGLGVAAGVATLVPEAHAHRLNLWAHVDKGATIKGRAYFSGGGRVRNVEVRVFGADEQPLGEVVTDTVGQFVFHATYRCDHQFVVNSEDGHRAVFEIKAAELPSELPHLPTSVSAGSRESQTGTTREDPLPQPPAERSAADSGETPVPFAPFDGTEFKRLVDETVARHVSPLREQLADYESRIRLHDVLAGIGYIVGITGLASYFLGWRRCPAGDRSAETPQTVRPMADPGKPSGARPD